MIYIHASEMSEMKLEQTVSKTDWNWEQKKQKQLKKIKGKSENN